LLSKKTDEMSLIRDRINKNRNRLDIGLDKEAQKGRQRTINLDGSYNIKRITGERIDFDLYHWLITTSWNHYWIVVFVFYGAVNVAFALGYYFLGYDSIGGIVHTDPLHDFLQCFFFSNETFTTVGYGSLHPNGVASSLIASLEAFLGLMSFALATGTLYGRFSRPKPRIKFSPNAIIAPFGEMTAFQFVIANQRTSNIMELEVTINFSWVDTSDGESLRRFKLLNLELSKIAMFPMSWTINHIIDEESPMYGMSAAEILSREIEAFITLKGYDETYSQTIYIRRSYTAKDIIYGAKFERAFYVGESGQLIMDLRKVGSYNPAPMPAQIHVEIEKHLETIAESEL
jgi:inward rectifier potassium channel